MPGAINLKEYEAALFAPTWEMRAAIETLPTKDYIGVKQRRRMGRLSRMAVIAGKMAIENAGKELDDKKAGIFLGTGYGEVEHCYRFFAELYGKDPKRSPTAFINSLHSTAASYLCIELGFTGMILVFSDLTQSFEVALMAAYRKLKTGQISQALVIGADCATDVMREVGSLIAPDVSLMEGACALMLIADEKKGVIVEEVTVNPKGDDDSDMIYATCGLEKFIERFGLNLAGGGFEIINGALALERQKTPYTGAPFMGRGAVLKSRSQNACAIRTKLAVK